MENQKFEISGEIEGSEKTAKNRSIIGRFFLFLLVVIVVGSIWYFPFLQDEFPALKKITMGSNSITAADTTLLNQNFELQAKIDSLQNLNDSLIAINQLSPENENSNEVISGVYYEVQIGIFKHFDITKYAKEVTGLHAEKINAEEAKITLGKFTDRNAAKDFLKDIKEMGIKDAWIVAKENGERVPFEN